MREVALGHASEASEEEEELITWVARVKPTVNVALIAEAVQIVDQVLAPNSELCELWEESDESEEWQADITFSIFHRRSASTSLFSMLNSKNLKLSNL